METQRFPYASFDEEEKVEGCSKTLYNNFSLTNGKKLEELPKDGFTTLLEGFSNAVKAFPDNNCLGHVEGDKYVWRTYAEAHKEAEALAKVLFSDSMVPITEGDGKDLKMMGLYSRNRPEWAIVNWAVMHFSGTVVTLYNTLGEDSLKYAFDHTEMTIVSCDEASFKKLLTFRKDGGIKSLKTVI
jgi:long-chain acyl-CoA synthetase